MDRTPAAFVNGQLSVLPWLLLVLLALALWKGRARLALGSLTGRDAWRFHYRFRLPSPASRPCRADLANLIHFSTGNDSWAAIPTRFSPAGFWPLPLSWFDNPQPSSSATPKSPYDNLTPADCRTRHRI